MVDIKAGTGRNLPNQIRLSQTIPEDTGKTTTRSRHPNFGRSLMVVALITSPRRIASRLSAVFLLLLAVPALVKPASAQDPSCKPVLDAVVLQARTTSHVYSTMTGSSGNMTSETITTNDAEYTKTIPPGGSWRKSSYSPKNQAEQAAQAGRSYTSCQHVGDETVNGEATAIYTEINKESGVSGKVWISKKSGLPLKGELGLPTSHFSMRYEYSNVRPPANGQ